MAADAHAVQLPAWRHLITEEPRPRTLPVNSSDFAELRHQMATERYFVLAWIMDYHGSTVSDKVHKVMHHTDQWRSHDFLLEGIAIDRVPWDGFAPPATAPWHKRIDEEKVGRWETIYRDSIMVSLIEAPLKHTAYLIAILRFEQHEFASRLAITWICVAS